MRILKKTFEPLPDDVEFVDTVDELPLDDHDPADDGDDRVVPAGAPNVLARAAARVRSRG